MLGEILEAAAELDHVLARQVGLRDAAVVFQRPDGRNDHDSLGVQSRGAALDIEELLRAQFGGEARFGENHVTEFLGEPRRREAVTAVGDVRERPAVDERGRALGGLNEIRLDSVAQDGRHRSLGVQVAGKHRRARRREPDQDASEPLFQVGDIGCEAENRHHFRGGGDIEARLTHPAVRRAAEATHGRAQRPIVHVHDAAELDTAWIETQRVALHEVVVDHRRKQIVRGRNGMDVAREMEIDVLHRDDLSPAAACGSAFDAEDWPHRGLAQADDRPPADDAQGVAETDSHRRLAFASGRRRHRRHENEFCVGLARQPLENTVGYLRFVRPVKLDFFGFQTEVGRQKADRARVGARRRSLRDAPWLGIHFAK
ncbi:MAG: hypothetical protein BWY66_00638 [bacterium ADurb.Bin374]|nr:MAG: hypothetical protein BWY66_00638 [bacterium ADurb.Bin374]